jgi:hypothetical protein
MQTRGNKIIPGVHFCGLQPGVYTETKRMVLVK